MRKWLRPWFHWQFGLKRLVLAVLFLGACVGLNMRKIGPISQPLPLYLWGWPFPSAHECDVELHIDAIMFTTGNVADLSAKDYEARLRESDALLEASVAYRLPLTHSSYRLLHKSDSWQLLDSPNGELACAVINALFALIVSALLLHLQIPRRQVVAKVE